MERQDNVVEAEVGPGRLVREAGSEPIPGYRLIAPLGRGGFGEVWKCEAPGGLHKAVKFVYGTAKAVRDDDALAQQELAALERIKGIRHPFLLSMERVEVIGGELVIVTELADQTLQDVLDRCRAAGLPGVPRDELLGYLLEAAEALDVLGSQHGLQHLDVKPRNLFLVSNHVKVGDFGLVFSVAEAAPDQPRRGVGINPLYASPENFQGRISRHSDQYSLAVSYQELLTGTLPFAGKNARQLMMQHLTAEPDLGPLPAADRPLAARALAKEPEQRFPSCTAFAHALVHGHATADTPPNLAATLRTPALLRRPPAQARCGDPARPPAFAPDQAETPPGLAVGAGETVSAPPVDALIPGCQVLECLGHGPLGGLYKVRVPDGRERLARLLPGFLSGNPQAVARLTACLRALRHPALPATEVVRTPGGQMVLVSDGLGRTLRDRLEECLAEGLPGIPRQELLGLLGKAAEALDTLYQQHGLQHLGLNPRSLLVDSGRVRPADFGLVQLVWLASGEPPGKLNLRYAAPEMLATGPNPTSDQYSLALIYAEMLTGVQPKAKRSKPRSGQVRRSGRPDLDLLPAPDRNPISRALQDDPGQRFASCTELVQALQAASGDAGPTADVHSLPPVIPYRSLLGEPAAEGTVLPSTKTLVMEVIAAGAGGAAVCERGSYLFLRHPQPFLEHRFLTRLLPKLVPLKLRAFREQFKAEAGASTETSFTFRLTGARSFWQQCLGGANGLECQVDLEPLPLPDTTLFQVAVRVRPFGNRGRYAEMLEETGPLLLDSLRSFLQADTDPEQRAQERWPCAQPLRVFPVLPNLDLGAVIEGTAKEIALGGIGFWVAQLPSANQVYLYLYATAQLDPYALLARIVWHRPCEGGGFDVGAALPADTRPPGP